MSGLGVALSGFVNGFVDGRNVRHAWDDRKDENVRKKRTDELRETAEKRAQESHDMGLTTSGLMNDARRQQLRLGEQQWEDQAAFRKASEADVRLAEGGMGASPPSGPALIDAHTGTTPMPEVVAPTVTQPVLSYGRTAGSTAAPAAASPGLTYPSMGASPEIVTPVRAEAMPGAAAAPDAQIAPQQSPTAPPAQSAATDALFATTPDGKIYATRVPRNAQERADILAAAKEGRLTVSPERMTQQQAIDGASAPTMGAAPESSIPLLRDIDRLGRGVIDAGKAVGRAGLGWGEQVANSASDALDFVNEPFRATSQYLTGQDAIGAAPRAGDINGDGREKSITSPVVDMVRPAPESPERASKALEAEAKKAPGEKALAASASAVMDDLGDTPDMKAAADAVTPQALGATPGRPMTTKQVEKGATTLIESWRKTGAPNVTRELLRQGRIEEAQALETFVKSGEAQRGMKLWAKGMFQAQMGDMVGAFDTWIDGYNAAGYYDDGYSVLKDQSSIIRDGSGNPIGVDLTFKNEATGEVFKRQMTPEDMGQTFGLILSPTEAYAASQERQKALTAALLKQQEEDAKTRRDLIVDDYKADRKAQDAAAQYLFEQGNDPLMNPDGGLSLGDARRKALGAAPVLSEDDLPIYR